MFLDDGHFASEIQRDIYVSDKHNYISGELFTTDNGYELALMLSDRGANSHGVIALLQNDNDYYTQDPAVELYEVGVDEPAILHITDLLNQSVHAITMERNRVVEDRVYSLQKLTGISDGISLSEYSANEVFA